jgi:hypothetical protein
MLLLALRLSRLLWLCGDVHIPNPLVLFSCCIVSLRASERVNERAVPFCASLDIRIYIIPCNLKCSVGEERKEAYAIYITWYRSASFINQGRGSIYTGVVWFLNSVRTAIRTKR